ncbi:MAG: alpha,6-mannosyltransferase, partial [Solirubrobacteraceae bacterium]|nr:alpha,6-mannosyltransferase [Solirubrobacteraceae bacterium]
MSSAHALPAAGTALRRRGRVWRRAADLERVAGLLALAGLVVSGFVLGAGAAGQRLLFFVPAGRPGMPDWLAGPFSEFGVSLDAETGAQLLLVMCACYVVALACARRLPMWAGLSAIGGLHLVFLLAPPIFSADVFGYIDYARLGVVHGIDPYLRGAAAAPADPVVPFVGWHDVPSPYGPLFTLASYALAPLSVAAALWTLKGVAALASLAGVALVWRIAARRGHAPLPAAMFVGLNPLLVVYGVGGAHNDMVLVVIMLAAVSFALARRPAGAGAAAVVATGFKASGALLLPFLLAGSRDRRRTALGALAAGAVVTVAAVVAFGAQAGDFVRQIHSQQDLVAAYSLPNRVGIWLGYGGVTNGIRAVCLVV